MGLGCGTSILKYSLFLFNIIFFIIGAAILGVSIWILVDPNIRDYIDLATNASGNEIIDIALYFMCAVGAFTFLVGLLGCCGACQESSCMLCTYAVLVGFIFTLQIVGAILAAVFKDEIQDGLESGMSHQANRFVTGDIEDVTTLAWARMQMDWECCGGKDHTDYLNSRYVTDTNNDVPPTCCKLNNDDEKDPDVVDYAECQREARENVTNPVQLHGQGCYQGLSDFINDQSTIIIGIGFGLAAFQLICIIFACCVRNKVNESEEYA